MDRLRLGSMKGPERARGARSGVSFLLPRLLPLALLGAACTPGDVDVKGVHGFGTVSATLWIEAAEVTQYWTLKDGEGRISGGGRGFIPAEITLMDRGVDCRDRVQSMLSFEAASLDLLLAQSQGRLCEAAPAYFQRIADDHAKQPAPRDVLSFYRWETGDFAWGTGSFALGPAGAGVFSGVLTHRGHKEGLAGFYQRAADAWDVEACALKPEFWTWVDETVTSYALNPGTLEIDRVEAKAEILGEVEATLRDPESGDEEGTIWARFLGTYCELPEVDAYVQLAR